MQKVRGTRDLYGLEKQKFRFIEATAFGQAQKFGYSEIETPIFEFSEVFHRSLGETSDAVSKETYTFSDRGGDSLTLRPEGTAGVARAFISEGLAQELPLKLYYYGPMFRYERPQKGRYRQFYQVGVENLGPSTYLADVESLQLAWNFLTQLGLKDSCILEINTLGDVDSRARYRERLVDYLLPLQSQLSADSQTRLLKNPLRILDSKDANDQKLLQDAPTLKESLSAESKVFFDSILKHLTQLNIPFVVNEKLVRGLDYYCHTVFEFTTTLLGAQSAVLSGGRYDGLIETLGGPKTPGVGWAAGVDRLADLVNAALLPQKPTCVCILPADEKGEELCSVIAQTVREQNQTVEILTSGNFGKKMKRADKLQASHVIILGENELKENKLVIKDMKTSEQKEVLLPALKDFFK